MKEENEYAYSVVIRDTKMDRKQIAEAFRDLITHFDPNVGIVFVQEVPEYEDSAFYYSFDFDRYPELVQYEMNKEEEMSDVETGIVDEPRRTDLDEPLSPEDQSAIDNLKNEDADESDAYDDEATVDMSQEDEEDDTGEPDE